MANSDLNLMFQVCRKFYFEQMNKVEISKQLHISRFKVARLLEKALNEGYVKIKLDNFPDISEDLSKKLEEKLKISTAIVINTDNLSEEEIAHKVQKESAEYISSVLSENDILGISCGTTLAGITSFLPEVNFPNLEIAQITGGFHLLKMFDGVKLLSDLGKKFNTDVRLFLAPALVKDKHTKEILMSENTYAPAVNLFSKITVAVTAIGAWQPELISTLYKAADFSEESIKKLKENNVTGDIFNHLFDTNGNIIDECIKEQLMAISVKDLSDIPCKILVSYDPKKSFALEAATQTGLVDVLITDTLTAKNIIQSH